MPTLTIDIPPAVAGRVLDAFCAYHGYQDQLPDPVQPGVFIPNPQSKQAFAKARIVAYVKQCVLAVEGQSAADVARAGKLTEIEGMGIS